VSERTSAGGFKPIAKGVAIFAIGIVVGLAMALWWATTRPRSLLTTGLYPDWKVNAAQFDVRVRARFPVGTPASMLVKQLEAEGFAPTWFEANGEYGAERYEGDFVCNVAARVYWRVGQNAKLTAIRGIYREEGCL
jgi:hypothetical protein